MKLITCFLITILPLFVNVVSANEKAKASVDIISVSVQPYQSLIKRTGKLAFKRTLNLSFKSSGYLTGLTVDEGEYFTKGQVLARLDVAELIANKNSKYALLMQAKREVTRIKSLIAKNLSSAQQLDNAKTLLATHRAAYKVAYYNLEKAQIMAPFSGIVLTRYATLGELQVPGKNVLTVAANTNNWVVKVALTEAEIHQIQLKQKAQVNLYQTGLVEGIVIKIPAMADLQNNLFTIEVLLPQLDRSLGLIAGQPANVHLSTVAQQFVYPIPMAALIRVDQQGKAIIAVQSVKTKKIALQSFAIFKMDNKFIYLFASPNNAPLQLVKQGWQSMNILAK